MALKGPLDEYRKRDGSNDIDWTSVFRTYANATGAPRALSDEQAMAEELAQAREGAGFVGGAKKAGGTFLKVAGGVLEAQRQLVVAAGTGLWNSGIAPVLDSFQSDEDKAAGLTFKTDVNDDGQVTSDDNIVGQFSRALNPFDDRNVIGMGRLAPFLHVEDDDSIRMRALKLGGALALDSITDPTIVLGPASRVTSTASRASLAGADALELGAKVIGKELSRDKAVEFTAKQLAKKSERELLDMATRAGVDVGRDGFQTLGRSTDDAARELAERFDDETLTRIFSSELAVESQAAVRANNFSGLRRTLESSFGEDTGRTLFNMYKPEVRGAIEFGLAGTKLRVVAQGNYGGGQIVEKFGKAGHILEEALIWKQRAADTAIGRITPRGGRKAEARSARLAAAERRGLEATATQFGLENKIVTETSRRMAVRMATGAFDDMFKASENLIRARQDIADKSGNRGAFDDAVRRFDEMDDLDAVDISRLSETEMHAFESMKAVRNVQSKYVEYRDTYGELFSEAGVIPGQRRVLDDEGWEMWQKLNGGTKREGKGGFRGRQAFEVLDTEGNFQRWMTVSEVNDALGADYFIADPFKANKVLAQRTRKRLAEAAYVKHVLDSGVVVADSRDGGGFFDPRARVESVDPETGKKVVTNVSQGQGTASRVASGFEGRASKAAQETDLARAGIGLDTARIGIPELRGQSREAAQAAAEHRRAILAEMNEVDAQAIAEVEQRVAAARAARDEAIELEDGYKAAEIAEVDELRAMEREYAKAYRDAKRAAERRRKEEFKATEADLKRATPEREALEAEAEQVAASYEDEIERLTRDRDAALLENAEALDEELVEARILKQNADAVHAGRVNQAREREAALLARLDVLADPDFVTKWDAATNDFARMLNETRALLATLGTKTDVVSRSAANKRATRDLFTAQFETPLAEMKRGMRDRQRAVKSGEIVTDADVAAANSKWRETQARIQAETIGGLAEARRAAVDAAIPGYSSKVGKASKELDRVIGISDIDEEVEKIIQITKDARVDELDLRKLTQGILEEAAPALRKILDSANAMKPGERLEAMRAFILQYQEAAARETDTVGRLAENAIDQAAAKRLELSFKDKNRADALRQMIEDQENLLGLQAAADDPQVAKWIDELNKIENRADVELRDRAPDETMVKYMREVEKELNGTLRAKETKAAASQIKKVRTELEQSAAREAQSFNLAMGGTYRSALIAKELDDGSLVRLSTITHKGKEITIEQFLQDYMATPMVAEALAREFREVASGDLLSPGFLTAVRALETMWKSFATVLRGPSFVTRNIFGGIYNALLGGTSSADFGIGNQYMLAMRRARQAAEDAATGPDSAKLLRPDNLETFFDDFVKAELDFEAFPGVSMYEIHQQMMERNVLGGSLASEIQGVDPLEVARPSYKWQYRDLASGLERKNMNAIERGYYGAGNRVLNSGYARLMGGFQDNAETFLRTAQYVAGIRRGGNGLAGNLYGEMLVKATQFDYQDLSPFERKVLRHVFPFFTFTKNNLPLQLRSLVNRPGVPMSVLRLNDYANEYFGGDDEHAKFANESLPPWLREAGGFASSFDLGGGPVVFGIAAPIVDLNRYFPEGGDSALSYVKKLPGAFAEESVSQVNPAVKFAIESATGTNLYTGSEYRDKAVSPGMAKLFDLVGAGSGKVDPETGEKLYSGFAEQQIKNFLPPLAQLSRLVPYGPLEDKEAQARLGTTITGSGLGLSGLPVAPLATATEKQLENWMKGSTKDFAREASAEFASVGLDWGDISRAANTRTWADIAAGIEAGYYQAEYIENQGGPTPEQARKMLELAAKIRAAAK